MMTNLNGRLDTMFHFHLHTQYSLLDGFSTPEEYLKRCTELGIKGIGVTEHGNMYSAPYFEKEKNNYPDVKTCYGVEFYEAFDSKIKDGDNKYFHLVGLAKNENGRLALNRLITESYMEENFYHKPRVDLNMLKEYADDLIISSACLGSKIAKESDYEKCLEYVEEYKGIFKHFYLEMQSHKSDYQVEYNKKILSLAQDTSTPFVITTDSHASSEKELYYQSYHVKIAKDLDTASEIYEGCYLQDVDTIYETMIPQIGEENVTIALQTSLDILDLIEDVKIPFSEPNLPVLELGELTPEEKLEQLAYEGLKKRTIADRFPEKIEIYTDRLKSEMEVIKDTGFSSYFLIVWDFLNYAKSKNMPVSDSRGSAGGSLVLYLIGITNIDPIKYGLIFERFLNKERINFPDIDADFADQQAIISYLEDKYGEKKVCRVLNFSYITPKVAIKDVGDIFGVPYAIRDEISKLFPSPDFDYDYKENEVKLIKYMDENPEYETWFDIARNISGKIRQTSIHACAVGILNSEVSDIMPVQIGKKGEKIIQCDGKLVELLGIVKFDILGVKTLRVVYDTLGYLGKDMAYLDLDNDEFTSNKKAYDIISSGNTDGLFQIESYGMKDLFQKINARNIGEISDGISLYRPDAMGYIPDYLAVKAKEKKVGYIHEDMVSILSPTNGSLIYQEQVLEIIRTFGGRSYGGADIVRRAIGKKNKEDVMREAEKIRQEILDNGYEHDVSEYIANYLADAGSYSFNKSHGVGYSTLVYKTAFLKANHPVEYMTALLNSELGNFESINKYILNCKQMGIDVLPPSINKSEEFFTINSGKILFGICMIKGVGSTSSVKILEERKNGKFTSFENFIDRCSIDKGSMVALIKSGIFGKEKLDMLKKYCDSLFPKREFKPLKSTSGYTIARLEEELKICTKDKEERLRLFNIFKEKQFHEVQAIKLKKHRGSFLEKYMQNRAKWEFETLSLYLTHNPLEDGLRHVYNFDDYDIQDKVTTIGTVISIQKKNGKSGQYAFIDFYNGVKNIELIFWSRIWSKYSTRIKKGMDLAVIGIKEDGNKVVATQVKPYKAWCAEKGI